MSVEIYVSRFQSGIPANFQQAVLRVAVQPFLSRVESNAYFLKLHGAGLADTVLFADTVSEYIHSFTVSRPPSDVRLYRALLMLARVSGAVIYAPGSPPVVCSRESAAHLPEDMIQSLGSVVHVQSAEELLQALFGA
jgi:hypothetical protein